MNKTYSGSAVAGIGPVAESIPGDWNEWCEANEEFFAFVMSATANPDGSLPYCFDKMSSDDLANGIDMYGER